MKKLNCYEINDGSGGIILAKSLKHAIKKISTYYKLDTVKIIIDEIKKNENSDCLDGNYCLTDVFKVAKKDWDKKSRFLGFCE